MNSLEGLNAVVVGASSGIGKAIAELLFKEGCNCVVLSRKVDKLQDLKQIPPFNPEKPQMMELIKCDLLSKDSIQFALENVFQIFSEKIDILIMAAGITIEYDLEKTRPEDVIDSWEKVLNVNLVNTMHLIGRVMPYLLNNKQETSTLVTISCLASQEYIKNISNYSYSNWGVEGFMGQLFEDVREKGIKICHICPGLVNTPTTREKPNSDPAKMIQPKDIADTVVFVCKTSNTVCPTEIFLKPQKNPQTAPEPIKRSKQHSRKSKSHISAEEQDEKVSYT